MKLNAISKEELDILKRKKKTRISIIIAIIIFLVLGSLATVFTIRYLSEKDDISGQKINIGTNPIIEETDIDKIDYNDSEPSEETTENTTEDASTETSENSGEENGANSNTNQEFEVPDTELGPVEEVVGDNWFDENLFTKSEALVPLSYFDEAVFIGDSRTEGLVIYSGVSNLNAFCYKGLAVNKLKDEAKISIPGVSGSYTCFQAIEMTKFDSYYCMFGVNELGWIDSSKFIDEFDGLVDKILEVNPDAIVYVKSILPVTKNRSATDNIYNQTKINEYNLLIRQMCEDRGDAIYLDVASAVLDKEGYLPEEATIDGVHLNSAYCKRVIQYIRGNTFTLE